VPSAPGSGPDVIARAVAEVLTTLLELPVVVESHVDWAIKSRYKPVRDTVLIDDVFVLTNMDPSIRSTTSQSTMGSKIVCDATLKVDAGTF